MYSMAAVVLWFAGLIGILSGHLFWGPVTTMLALWLTTKALSTKGDMEAMFGVVFGLLIIVSAGIGAIEGWRYFFA